MSEKVLIAAPVHEVLRDGLIKLGYELIEEPDIRPDSAVRLIADCTGVVTSTRLVLDKALIDAAPRLKWIGRMGSGMELIDVGYAETKGIACFSSPQGNCNAVAEHALGLLLGLTKRIVHSANELRQGIWLREENRGIELEGRTIGIIGFGHTGRAFAAKLQGMDMNILVYDKVAPEHVPEYVKVLDSLERIWKEAEIVSFHVPMATDTYHYFDSEFLSKMRKPVILINTSRGTVVDTRILPEALSDGRLAGLGLDVYEEEPLSRMSEGMKELMLKISGHDQVILTPHIAGYSHEALYKMSNSLLMNILRLTCL